MLNYFIYYYYIISIGFSLTIVVCVLTLNLVSVYHIQQERNEYHRAHMVNLRQKEVFCVFLCHLV